MGTVYLYPPASSSRTALCSQPYPADMPFRTLHRSSSPQKNVACALDFLRYGFTEKRNVLIQYRRIVIARQSADCRGNPYPVGDARDAEEVFIYTHPPPFKVCFPLRENRMPYRRHGIISLLSFLGLGNGHRLSSSPQGEDTLKGWRVGYR